jgi:hypothetical protein
MAQRAAEEAQAAAAAMAMVCVTLVQAGARVLLLPTQHVRAAHCLMGAVFVMLCRQQLSWSTG